MSASDHGPLPRLLLDDALRMANARRRVPTATYRLQMNAGFTLHDALRIVPYLHRLGISHLYLSSILMARPGSLHGYDVMDHARLNPELGTEQDLRELVDELHRRQMGLILDVVPNHMWVGEGNAWWMDVLENGPSSRYAGYFDIAWQHHPRKRLKGKVLLPVLDEPYGKAIQAGRFKPFYEDGRFGMAIDQTRLPLDPRTYHRILEPALETLRAQAEEDAAEVLELHSIVTAIRHLAPRDEPNPDRVAEALAEITVIKRRLRELTEANATVAAQIDQAVQQVGGMNDKADGFAHLVELLDGQPYRPCFWRVALDEINYRRFFEINDLAALSAERLDVFQAIHAKHFEWLRNGYVDGFRVDHVDGLLNPKEYLDHLQHGLILACAEDLWNANPEKYGGETWSQVQSDCRTLLETEYQIREPILFVVVEKILGSRESLPPDWVCDGTTGYELANEVNRLFVDPDAEAQFTAVYQHFTGQSDSFDQVAYEKKLEILRSTMASELHVLAHRLDHLAQMEWWSRDFTLNGLRQALEQMIACFPVYRSYVFEEPSVSDRISILRAARRARSMSAYLGPEIFGFICDVLLLKDHPNTTPSDEYRMFRRQFVGKFQQLTSPVMAKGVEDTALYVFNRLLSLNEVGGDPSQFGRRPQELHEFFKNRAAKGRNGLSPLSTHDTKRSEDVRARINVLSEVPKEWERRVQRWRRLNRQFKVEVDEGVIAPDDNEEYFLYQTLVGAWPAKNGSAECDEAFVTRIQAYLTKSLREAKIHSSWIHPETKYDDAVSAFVASVLRSDLSAEFHKDLCEFLQHIDRIAKINSLSQTLIRCIAPGIPDTYQGTESWDYSLVDPDNRHPVDYASLSQLLESVSLAGGLKGDSHNNALTKIFRSDAAKLFVVCRALKLRKEHAELFQSGDYLPLKINGPDENHLFSFLIADSSKAVLVVVPRLLAALAGRQGWEGSFDRLPIDASIRLPVDASFRTWKNALSGDVYRFEDGMVAASRLFADFPLALLMGIATDS